MLDFGFYNMDCMEGMKEFPDKYFDLAIVDPPYGINIGSSIGGDKPFGKSIKENIPNLLNEQVKTVKFLGGVTEAKSYRGFDDSCIPDNEYFTELKRVSKNQIIWGGNYFIDHLEATKCMIIWDKCRRGIRFADCEIAWTNIDDVCRIFSHRWNGMLQEDMKNKEKRIHPTQKPVALYKWLLRCYAKQGDKILDTHVGSASSLIACYDMGFDYVGFEIDEEYYKLACQRLEEEKAQIRWLRLP